MWIHNPLMMELMRGSLTEMSQTLKGLREDTAQHDVESFPVMRNGVLFSLDMSLTSLHFVGMKLYQEQSKGEVELHDSERALIGMCATFMDETLAGLIDDALEGRELSPDALLDALRKGGLEQVADSLMTVGQPPTSH